jgi:Ca2+-binding RTX toxin-like protein
MATAAGAGERNQVTMRGQGPRTVVFRDAGAAITVGRNCVRVSVHEASCEVTEGNERQVEVVAGDRNDRVDARALFLRGVTVLLSGESGSDVLLGSRSMTNALFGDRLSDEGSPKRGGNDRLVGGNNNDDLEGDAGDDRIDALGPGRDHVDCGRGRDLARVGRGGSHSHCETVRHH